ncbi:hypothetical protein JTE90_015842 [Oedothorax gibbosus]|uniref:Uncharacterized protein n=1 Tax=Oedothorax gibbosus TaxID=931172 RepID=A0AAV6VT19_9ARAC|nr:hypothetical protein JTE90_015842 [Oedothorax gibbosus]
MPASFYVPAFDTRLVLYIFILRGASQPHRSCQPRSPPRMPQRPQRPGPTPISNTRSYEQSHWYMFMLFEEISGRTVC